MTHQRRVYVPLSAWHDGHADPAPEEERHLVRVLRVADGEMVCVFDGCGREADAIVRNPGGNMRLELQGQSRFRERKIEILLVQPVLKGQRMDFLVEKACELGVSRIAPVLTERTVVKLESERRQGRAERWRKIAVAAAKQSGSSWVAEVLEVMDLREGTAVAGRSDAFFVGALSDRTVSFKDAIASTRAKTPSSVALLMGPEGDLTDEEIALAIEAGGVPVSLGPRVLRAETASLYGLSVVAHEYL